MVWDYGSINLDFFGLGAGPGDDRSTDLNFERAFLLQDIRHRIGRGNWFLGLDYTFTNIDTTLELPGQILPPFRFSNTSSGIGALVHYDSRNNHFTPGKGIDALLGARFYGEAIGSDNDFVKVRDKFRTWLPFGERVTLGLRLDAEGVSDDDVAFYITFGSAWMR